VARYWQLQNIKSRTGEIPGTRFYYRGPNGDDLYIYIPISIKSPKKKAPWKISLVNYLGVKKHTFRSARKKETTLKNLVAFCEIHNVPVPPLKELLEVWKLNEGRDSRIEQDWEGLEQAERNLEWKKERGGRLSMIIERGEYIKEKMGENKTVQVVVNKLREMKNEGLELPTRKDIKERRPRGQALYSKLDITWRELDKIIKEALDKKLIEEGQMPGQKGKRLIPTY